MEPQELHPLIASSTDPTKVSNYVSGLILSASSMVIMFAEQFLHITLSPTDLTSLATGIGMTAGAIWFIFGIFRKVVVKVGTTNAGSGPVLEKVLPGQD